MVKDIRDDNSKIVKTLKKGKKIDYKLLAKLKHKPKKLREILRKNNITSLASQKSHKMSSKQADKILKETKNVRDLKKLKSLIPDPKNSKYANVE